MSSTTPIVAPTPQISLIAPPLVTRAPTDSSSHTIPVSAESNSYVPTSQDDRDVPITSAHTEYTI